MRSRLPLQHLCLGAMALMTGLLAPAALRAQQRAVPPTPQVSAGPNTLSGIVTDVTGKPLPDVDVYVDQFVVRGLPAGEVSEVLWRGIRNYPSSRVVFQFLQQFSKRRPTEHESWEFDETSSRRIDAELWLP